MPIDLTLEDFWNLNSVVDVYSQISSEKKNWLLSTPAAVASVCVLVYVLRAASAK